MDDRHNAPDREPDLEQVEVDRAARCACHRFVISLWISITNSLCKRLDAEKQTLVRTCVLVGVLRRSKNVAKPRPYVIAVDRMVPNYLIFLVCRCHRIAQIAKKFACRTDRLAVVFFPDRITAQLAQMLPVEVGLARANRRGSLDRFEQEKVEFFRRVRQYYLDMARQHDGRYRVIDAALPLEAVQNQLDEVIKSVI